MTEREFAHQVLKVMAGNWPKRTSDLSDEQTLIWRNALSRFTVGDIVIAFRTHAEKAKFFPAPCEITKICYGNKPDDRGGPRNHIDYTEIERQCRSIEREEAADTLTLSSVSDDGFAQCIKECVRRDRRLSHLKGKNRDNRMAQVFVCNLIESGYVPRNEVA